MISSLFTLILVGCGGGGGGGAATVLLHLMSPRTGNRPRRNVYL